MTKNHAWLQYFYLFHHRYFVILKWLPLDLLIFYNIASLFVRTLRNAARASHCAGFRSFAFFTQKIVDKTKNTGRFYTPGEEIKT